MALTSSNHGTNYIECKLEQHVNTYCPSQGLSFKKYIIYIKIENFRTIKLSDKILSESLFVRNVVMSESFKFIENRKAQRNVT